jgi:MoaA/NifB/PqqE/SkfB family radical SAM enzyme
VENPRWPFIDEQPTELRPRSELEDVMPEVEAFCRLPFSKIKVSPEGNVRMCCYQKGSLGNLFRQDITEIWDNLVAREVRSWTKASDLHPLCVGWGGCPFLVRPRTPIKIVVDHDLPTVLEFDLPNTHCNIGGLKPTPETACFMCPRADSKFRPQVDRTMELVERLRPIMSSLAGIRVQGTAEPFWRDKVFDILERLNFPQYREKCHFSTYTNGTVFDEYKQQRFIDLCPNSALFFSIDAATPETYTKIRRISVFHRVIENIRSFIRNKGPRQQVEIANNLNLYNLHEAVQMVELADNLGVPRVQFNPTHTAGGRTDLDEVLVSRSNHQRFAAAEKCLLERASELGIAITLVRPLALGMSETLPA